MTDREKYQKYQEKRIQDQLRMRDAAQRITDTVTELHLTWYEFEEVLKSLKYSLYVSGTPGTAASSSSNDE